MAKEIAAKGLMDPYEVTPELVRHVAALAALDLGPGDLEHFQKELNRILGHMKQLKGLDTEGIEAAFQTLPLVNVMREDSVEASLPREETLQNAPGQEGPFFRMPPILEGDKL